MIEYEVHIFQDGFMVASVFNRDLEAATAEAGRYVAQYIQDGSVELVTRVSIEISRETIEPSQSNS